jgi:hypothetical protein
MPQIKLIPQFVRKIYKRNVEMKNGIFIYIDEYTYYYTLFNGLYEVQTKIRGSEVTNSEQANDRYAMEEIMDFIKKHKDTILKQYESRVKKI